MVADFYERSKEAFAYAVLWGENNPYYLKSGRMLVWLVYVSISSFMFGDWFEGRRINC